MGVGVRDGRGRSRPLHGPGEEIRFRVVDEVFIDTSPTGPSAEKEGPSAAEATAPLQERRTARSRKRLHTHS